MLALGMTLGLAASEAHAADGAGGLAAQSSSAPKWPVHVWTTADCPVTRLDDVLAVLRVEIPGRLTDDVSLGAAYNVEIECEVDTVRVTASTPSQGTRTTRTTLAGVPPSVRARILALALAEIVGDLDREASHPPPPPAELSAPSPPPALAETPEGRGSAQGRFANRPVHMAAFAQTSSFRFDGRWLAGGGLRFEYSSGHLCAGIDATFSANDQRFSFGVTQSMLVYASPYVGWAGGKDRLGVRLGAGYALGAARLSGRATDPRFSAAALSGAWTAPYGFAALSLILTDAVRAEGRIQAGWVTTPVVGEVAAGGDIRFEGLWASAQIGFALGL
jgi:hypothetical protein